MHDREKQTGKIHDEHAGKEMKEERSSGQSVAPINERDIADTKEDQSQQRENAAGSSTAIPLRGDETIGNP